MKIQVNAVTLHELQMELRTHALWNSIWTLIKSVSWAGGFLRYRSDKDGNYVYFFQGLEIKNDQNNKLSSVTANRYSQTGLTTNQTPKKPKQADTCNEYKD